MQKKFNTPFSYYGGKQTMAKYILPLIPEHTTYVEPFVGGGAIFWLKKPSKVEVINDTNKELMNFYEVVKTDFPALEKEIAICLHSRSVHQDAWVIYNSPHLFTPIQRARAVWVLAVQGFGGMLSSSWGRDKTTDKAVKSITNKRDSFTEEFAIRLQNVSLERRDAIRVILSCDHKDAFHYIDPPYYNADMGHYDGYTIEDFEILLKALETIEGKFMLSSYPSELLSKYKTKNNWFTKEFELHVAISNKGKRKIEVLTTNYPID